MIGFMVNSRLNLEEGIHRPEDIEKPARGLLDWAPKQVRII